VVVANLFLASQASGESTMDCYHTSPRALHEAQRGNADVLGVRPQVRIDLPSTTLLALLEWLAVLFATDADRGAT
jgi:hypothetical protein